MPVMVQDPLVAAHPPAAPAETAAGQPGPVAAGPAAVRERVFGSSGGRVGGPRGQRPHPAPPTVRWAEGRRGPTGCLGGVPGTGRGGLFCLAADLDPVLGWHHPVRDHSHPWC